MNVPTISTRRLDLVWMPPAFIEAVLEDRRAEAEDILGAWVPGEFPGTSAHWLDVRRRQMIADPTTAQWLTRAMVVREPREMVGHLGFHARPDKRNAVEIGYTVFGAHRRQGYALEAATSLIEWAARTHGIATIVASVSPDNEPSLSLVRKLGFHDTGNQQWDDEDGLELIFELSAPSTHLREAVEP